MIMRYRGFLVIVATVLFVMLAIPAHAQEGGPVLLSEDEAYQRDAVAYVDAFGGTIEEAVRRLKLQSQVSDLEVVLEANEPDTFSGLWIEHTPKFRVVVQLTKGGKESILPYIQSTELTDVIEVEAGQYTYIQKRERIEAVIRAMKPTGILFEAKTNVQDGEIEIYVTDAARLLTALQGAKFQLPSNVKVVTTPTLSTPQATWYGGRSLSGCTTGLSVKKSGIKYSSSAGHCSTTQVSPLTFYASYNSGAYDFSVLSVASGDSVTNWVADNISDSTPYYRVINAYTPRGSVGAAVCKNGASTGYTCGTIEDRYYTFNGSATYILVKSTSTTQKISCGGDSGAAWFSGSTGYGNHAAGWCDLGNNKAIFMPVQGMLDYGFVPMTVP